MSVQTLDFSYTQDRELSWLRFNERVMEEARDESVPLFERLKFAAIFTSNLDEFFMIRVGSIYDLTLIKQTHVDTKSGLTPAQQLAAIFQAVGPSTSSGTSSWRSWRPGCGPATSAISPSRSWT